MIKTAIPKRRYHSARYAATLLGDIASGDARNYRYLLAFVIQGQSEPVLYVYSEPSAPSERAAGAYCLRVVSDTMTETLDTHDTWGDLDQFAEQALQIGAQLLGLPESELVRVL